MKPILRFFKHVKKNKSQERRVGAAEKGNPSRKNSLQKLQTEILFGLLCCCRSCIFHDWYTYSLPPPPHCHCHWSKRILPGTHQPSQTQWEPCWYGSSSSKYLKQSWMILYVCLCGLFEQELLFLARSLLFCFFRTLLFWVHHVHGEMESTRSLFVSHAMILYHVICFQDGGKRNGEENQYSI